MKKGFTILELLVASMLLSMLIAVLTMIFQQGSIAWRTGLAGVADLDAVRGNIAELRESADNAYVWNNETHFLLGLWDDRGQLRKRAWDVDDEKRRQPTVPIPGGCGQDDAKLSAFTTVSVGSGSSGGAVRTYSVNVKSAGPDREFDTYDDIWSFPDEIN